MKKLYTYISVPTYTIIIYVYKSPASALLRFAEPYIPRLIQYMGGCARGASGCGYSTRVYCLVTSAVYVQNPVIKISRRRILIVPSLFAYYATSFLLSVVKLCTAEPIYIYIGTRERNVVFLGLLTRENTFSTRNRSRTKILAPLPP